MISPPFADAYCYLLLLLAKPSRSTLDTKKGYKSKIGSTSSVTLLLILNHNHDRILEPSKWGVGGYELQC